MKSQKARLALSALLTLSSAIAQAQGPAAPKEAKEAAPAPVAPVAAPAPVAPPAPAPAAPPAATAPVGSPMTQPVVVLPPPAFAKPPEREVKFKAPPIKPPRRHGNAGAPFALGMGVAMRWRGDAGYEKLHAKDRQNEFDLFASYDVYQPIRRIVIAAGVNYRHTELGDKPNVTLKTNAVQADVIARYTLTSFLFPQLRAGFGAQLARIDLADESGEFKAHDKSASAAGSIGAGLVIQTPRRAFETRRGKLASLSFGFLVEGGYAFAAPATFYAQVDSGSELDAGPVKLGKLDMAGPYLRLNGIIRF